MSKQKYEKLWMFLFYSASPMWHLDRWFLNFHFLTKSFMSCTLYFFLTLNLLVPSTMCKSKILKWEENSCVNGVTLFSFPRSSFLSRNSLNKKGTINLLRNQMTYGSSEGANAGTKGRRHGHITCYLLYADKLEVTRLSTELLMSSRI